MPQLTAQPVRDHLGIDAVVDEVAVAVVGSESADGYQWLRLAIGCPDGDSMPAFLLVPNDAERVPGVVIFHQHASRWHLGKSEVCGLAGDRTRRVRSSAREGWPGRPGT